MALFLTIRYDTMRLCCIAVAARYDEMVCHAAAIRYDEICRRWVAAAARYDEMVRQ